MFSQRDCWSFYIVVLGCFFLPLSAAQQDAAPQKNEAAPTRQFAKVILLKPLLRFEDIGSGGSTTVSDGIVSLPGFRDAKHQKALPKLTARDADFESRLLSAAKAALGSKATIMLPENLSEPGTEASERLNEVSSRLARGNVTDEAKTDLALLSVPQEQPLVLAHSLRIKVGPGRSWDPNFGTITSAMDSTLAQAALVCSNTGKVVSKNEQFIRKALKPDSSEFSKMLTLLYDGLEIKPGGVQCE